MVLKEKICEYPDEGTSLQRMIEQALRSDLHQIAGINIHHCHQKTNVQKIDDRTMYTVYTSFHGAYHGLFAFCAELDIMKQITEHMLDEKDNSLEDVIDSVKEFLNVLCGHIVGAIYQKTKAVARFHIPEFVEGIFIPKGDNEDVLVARYCTNEEMKKLLCMNDLIML